MSLTWQGKWPEQRAWRGGMRNKLDGRAGSDRGQGALRFRRRTESQFHRKWGPLKVSE